MEKKVSIILAVLMVISIAIGSSGYAYATDAEEIPILSTIKDGALTIAVSPESAPFAFYAESDGDTILTGLDVMLAGYIADFLNLDPEFVVMDSYGVVNALASQNVDIGLSRFTLATEKPDDMDLSDIYYQTNAEKYVVGIVKNNHPLCEAINLAIAEAKKDGFLSLFIAMANEECTGPIYEGLLDAEIAEAATLNGKEHIKSILPSNSILSKSTIPFAEEHNFQFSIPEHSIVVPVYGKITIGRSTIKPYTKNRVPIVTDYPVPTVVRSAPDDDGFVTYQISAKADISYFFDNDKIQKATAAAGMDSIKVCTFLNPFEIYDYYTGLYLGNSKDIMSCPIDGLDVYHSVIEYGGKEHNIFLKVGGETDLTSNFTTIYTDDSQTEKLVENALLMTGYECDEYTIRVPEDYDGLIMAFRGPNEVVPDYWDIANYNCGEGFSVDEPPVHYWDGDISKWTFIRVDDLL